MILLPRPRKDGKSAIPDVNGIAFVGEKGGKIAAKWALINRPMGGRQPRVERAAAGPNDHMFG